MEENDNESLDSAFRDCNVLCTHHLIYFRKENTFISAFTSHLCKVGIGNKT